MQLGDYGGRYVEYPLSKVVKGTAGTLHLAIVGTNASRPPAGKIEISSISLRTKQPGIPLSVEDMTSLMRAGAWDAVRWHLKRLLPTDDPVANYHYGRLLVTGLGGPLDYDNGATYLQKGLRAARSAIRTGQAVFLWPRRAPQPGEGRRDPAGHDDQH